MWSLPDIKRLNEQAVIRSRVDRRKTQRQLTRGQTCDYCSDKARHALPYYDVFSEDVKGYVYMCESCRDNYGDVPEGYFWCDKCQRLHTENYTWERYVTYSSDGEALCLNCALDKELDDPLSWITDANEVTWDTVRRSKHLIPVKGEHWMKRLDFVGNVEFDSMTGQCISGGGVAELKEMARDTISKHGRCMLILDAGYQFAVSVGVYAPKSN